MGDEELGKMFPFRTAEVALMTRAGTELGVSRDGIFG